MSRSLSNLRSGSTNRQHLATRYNFRQIVNDTPEYSERQSTGLDDKYLQNNRNESLIKTEASDNDFSSQRDRQNVLNESKVSEFDHRKETNTMTEQQTKDLGFSREYIQTLKDSLQQQRDLIQDQRNRVLQLQYDSGANLNKFMKTDMPQDMHNRYESYKRSASAAKEELRQREIQSIHRKFIENSRKDNSYASGEKHSRYPSNTFSFSEYKDRVLSDTHNETEVIEQTRNQDYCQKSDLIVNDSNDLVSYVEEESMIEKSMSRFKLAQTDRKALIRDASDVINKAALSRQDSKPIRAATLGCSSIVEKLKNFKEDLDEMFPSHQNGKLSKIVNNEMLEDDEVYSNLNQRIARAQSSRSVERRAPPKKKQQSDFVKQSFSCSKRKGKQAEVVPANPPPFRDKHGQLKSKAQSKHNQSYTSDLNANDQEIQVDLENDEMLMLKAEIEDLKSQLSKAKKKEIKSQEKKQEELSKYLEEISLLKNETVKLSEALKEQAKIMQEAHRKYRQQKQAKFKQEIQQIQKKYESSLLQERAILAQKDQHIAKLLVQLQAKCDQTDETQEEEDFYYTANDKLVEQKMASMRHHYEEVITSMKEQLENDELLKQLIDENSQLKQENKELKDHQERQMSKKGNILELFNKESGCQKCKSLLMTNAKLIAKMQKIKKEQHQGVFKVENFSKTEKENSGMKSAYQKKSLLAANINVFKSKERNGLETQVMSESSANTQPYFVSHKISVLHSENSLTRIQLQPKDISSGLYSQNSKEKLVSNSVSPIGRREHQ